MEQSETDIQFPPPSQPPSRNHFCCPIPNCKCNCLFYCLAAFLFLVILSGVVYLYSIRNQPPVPQTVKTKVIATTTPTINPTAIRKTYTEKDGKFSFDYPIGWSVIGNYVYDKEIQSPSGPEHVIAVSISNNPFMGPNLTDPIGTKKETGNGVFIEKLEDINLDGILSVKAKVSVSPTSETDTTPGIIVVSNKNDYYLSIYLRYVSQKYKPEELNTIFDQILSTFRFLDQPTPTSSSAEKQIGYIKSFNNNVITVDYVQWINCQTEDCPNGYKVTNTNLQLRNFSLFSNLEIFTQTYSNTASGDFNWNEKISLNQLINWVDYKSRLFWFTIQNDQITKIEEQYQP